MRLRERSAWSSKPEPMNRPIPATSFTIQSEQSGDGTGSYSAEVKGTYQPGGSGAVVYSVDIAWTDMNFTYTGAGEGTWNPETHQYEGGTEASWTDSNASVTVINPLQRRGHRHRLL